MDCTRRANENGALARPVGRYLSHPEMAYTPRERVRGGAGDGKRGNVLGERQRGHVGTGTWGVIAVGG